MRSAATLALVLGMLAAPAADPTPPVYRTAPDARPVGTGALLPGPGTYTDSIAEGETRTYRVRLDGSSNVFLSAVLAPAAGADPGLAVDVVDGVSLSLRTASGLACGPHTDVRFYGDTDRPVADYVSRRVEPGRLCQEPGEYLFVVEGVGRERGEARRRTLELGYVVEQAPRHGSGPGDAAAAPLAVAPTDWPTAPPAGVLGADMGRPVRGGTGFNDAAPLDGHGDGGGTWRDELRPGESRFYRIQVDWGQQLFVRARFGNAAPPPQGSALPDGLRLALYNPARGAVDERKELYTGGPAALLLATAPAAYANRTQGGTEAVAAMRFAGTYYVQLTLDRRAPGPVPLALDVAVLAPSGGPSPSPRPTPPPSPSPSPSGPDPALRIVGIAGVTTGTVLVAGLGAWPVVMSGRRRPRGRHAAGR
ncbi:hypothetical protein ACIGO8_03295 [Streptomyces sp. NPDC053493]|uniref:hypothetical protein n=1 Tax=Streptomyces sp. NPDC053493 TaxID=3365705 RepID=UPI0037D420AE